MATDYSKWESFAAKYDSDGDEMDLTMKVPVDHVSAEHLASKVRPEDITMACGKPMTRAEFEEYCSKRGIKPKVMSTPDGAQGEGKGGVQGGGGKQG